MGTMSDPTQVLKRKFGVVTDAELAAIVGKQRTVVSNWRKDNEVPAARLREFQECAAARGIAFSLDEFYRECVADAPQGEAAA